MRQRQAKPRRPGRMYVGVHVSIDLYEQLVNRQKQLNENADKHVSLGDVVRDVLRVEFPKPNEQPNQQPAK